MADDLDKFVLQYTVELKDSIKRLEQLNSKVESVNKQSGKSAKGMKEFANGAADEFGKVIPGVDKATAAVRAFGAEFAVATVAVAALGVGIKSVMDLRERFNAQRVQGRDQGVSGLRLEEYQRKFVKNSNGRITREKTADEISKFSAKISEAYADPSRTGVAARQFRMAGINVGDRGKPVIGTNTALTQLAERLQAMKPEQASGWAKSFGMNQDFAMSLRGMGSSVGQITEQSPADIQKRQDAEQQLDKFNDSLAKLKEQFTEAETVLGEHLLPAFSKLVDLFTKLAAATPDLSKMADHQATKAENFALGKSFPIVDMLNGMIKPSSGWGLGKDLFDMVFKPSKKIEQKKADDKKANDPAAKKAAEEKAKQEKATANALADAADKANEEGKQNTDAMNLAINMFAGAVATFANAIDEKQAWAAWAGEVGRSAGLGKSDDDNKAYLPTAPSKYDDIYAKASKATGVPVDLLKRVTQVESHFNPGATSPVGAQGLMQVMPSNFKSLGITNGYDPEQNIMGGAKLLKEYIGNSNSIREALMKYHGGYDKSGWGKNTLAYPGKVLGDSDLVQGDTGYNMVSGKKYAVSNRNTGYQETATGQMFKPAPVHGTSRDNIQLTSVQQNIAARMGLPNVDQLKQGGINKGDVTWAVSQLDGEYQNQISSLKVQLQNAMLTPSNRSKIITDLQNQESGLNQLRQYGGVVEDKAQDGPRTNITLGERAVWINVTGAGNPNQTAEAVMDKVHSGLSDLANSVDTGIKR